MNSVTPSFWTRNHLASDALPSTRKTTLSGKSRSIVNERIRSAGRSSSAICRSYGLTSSFGRPEESVTLNDSFTSCTTDRIRKISPDVPGRLIGEIRATVASAGTSGALELVSGATNSRITARSRTILTTSENPTNCMRAGDVPKVIGVFPTSTKPAGQRLR